ncbi:hypothetical protein AAC387_Pa01g3027 [Persea americana]
MGNCAVKLSCMDKNTKNETDDKIDFSKGNVHLVTSMESWDKEISQASKDGKIVVVNFSATWSGPCRTIAPLYSELSEKYSELTFLTVDVDELAELSSSWDLRATPSFFFLKDGQQLDKVVGANKTQLEKMVASMAKGTT